MSSFVSYCGFVKVSEMSGQDLKENFGRQVRLFRKDDDMTQSDLAEAVNVSTEYVSHIERGLASPSFDVIARIAQALNRDVAEMFAFD